MSRVSDGVTECGSVAVSVAVWRVRRVTACAVCAVRSWDSGTDGYSLTYNTRPQSTPSTPQRITFAIFYISIANTPQQKNYHAPVNGEISLITIFQLFIVWPFLTHN